MTEENNIHRLTAEELELLPLEQFEGEVVLIETEEEAKKAAEEMSGLTMLGFDTETRPSFKRGVNYKTALLQLSTDHKAWLLRLNKTGLPECMVAILENVNIVKAGVAIRDDIKGLQKWHNFVPGSFVELQSMAAENGIEDFSLKKLAAHVMGIRISKRQRLSNWEADVLTIPQQSYAATDAWVGLECYKGLKNGALMHPRLKEIIDQAQEEKNNNEIQ